jgi:RNA polymerase sigma-70 factor (ECF subfamily)
MNSSDREHPEQLLRLARVEPGEALGPLLEMYRGYLEILARVQIGRRLQGKVGASDVVQETFLEADRHFAQFRGTTEAEWVSWLRQILAGRMGKLVRHYVGTQRRDVRLERELALDLDQSSSALVNLLPARQISPSGAAGRREQDVLLAQTLDRLPPDYRNVLILRHLEELSFPEIARRMERSLDSVKNLWARALARLRDQLGGDE